MKMHVGFLLLAAVLLSLGTIAQASDWAWQNPLPQGSTLNTVAVRSATEAFAFGSLGNLLRWDGTQWHAETGPTEQAILDAVTLPSGVILVAGTTGTVLKYDGVSWTTIPTDFDTHLTAIWALSETDIYVAEHSWSGRRILHYDGVDWTHIGTAPGSINDIWVSGPNDIHVVGIIGMMYHYDGVSWSSVGGFPGFDFTGVWGVAANDVFAALQGFQLYHFDGVSWGLIATASSGSYTGDLWGSAANDVYMVDGNGGVACWDGSMLIEYDFDNPGFESVAGDGVGKVHAVGFSGGVYTFDGASWTPHFTAVSTARMEGVWGSGPANVFAVGLQGSFLQYDGATWTDLALTDTDEFWTDVWGTGPSDVFGVGSAGIVHYDGVDWQFMDDGASFPRNYLSVWGLAGNDVYATGRVGDIVHYDGVSWTEMNSGTLNDIFGVWGVASNDLWAVGPQNAFLHYDGIQWSSIAATTQGAVRDIYGFAADDIYALGSYGEMYHYDGVSWTELVAPLGSQLVSIWGSGPDDIYVVDFGSRVLHYDGVDWTWMTTGAGNVLRGVWNSGPNDVFIVGNQGAILHYGQALGNDIRASRRDVQMLSEPNPFNPRTTIRFELASAGRVRLEIYDVAGRRVRTLLDRSVPAGPVVTDWDGRDSQGRILASGVYLAALETGEGRAQSKLTLLK